MILCVLCTVPSPPRYFTITRVFDDGIELNWIPPREPNGDIQHYIIKYITQNGTQQEINTTNNINYYNLTGLARGQTYNIRAFAVNSAGDGGGSQPITSYVHNSTVESTREFVLLVKYTICTTYTHHAYADLGMVPVVPGHHPDSQPQILFD